jgi:dienelactone hydrolase
LKGTFRVLAFALGIVALLGVGLFVLWGLNLLGPGDQAMAALSSDTTVTVTDTGKWITFAPAGGSPMTGLILYPGAHVDHRSYAPIAREIASRGYLVTLVKMPLGLAIFAPERAEGVISAHPEIRYWAVGGHSLGGVMAARYALRNLDKVQGVGFLASYPADNLSGTDLKGVQIYGSNDTVLNPDAVSRAAPFLPPGTIIQVIDGGNHSGFGDYPTQSGDGVAEISAEEQQALTVDLLGRLLRAIEGE